MKFINSRQMSHPNTILLH